MRMLFIEDDPILAQYIIKGMEEHGFDVVHAVDGEAGLAAALAGSFDLAIIDLMLPKLDGLGVIDGMRGRGVGCPILILSAKREIDDRVRGLRIGSDDYLTKPFSFSELHARVDALLRRPAIAQTSTKLENHGVVLDLFTRSVHRDGRPILLQPREFSLLEYLMRNSGHVVSKTMIMERVWNYNFDPCTNVVEARISKLREKVDKGFSTALIHTVRGSGYVFKVVDCD